MRSQTNLWFGPADEIRVNEYAYPAADNPRNTRVTFRVFSSGADPMNAAYLNFDNLSLAESFVFAVEAALELARAECADLAGTWIPPFPPAETPAPATWPDPEFAPLSDAAGYPARDA